MTCGLAEEETRLVTSRAKQLTRRRLVMCHSFRVLTCICERRIYVALSSLDWIAEPRIRDRPQTACGRSCPWEPTALRVRVTTLITTAERP